MDFKEPGVLVKHRLLNPVVMKMFIATGKFQACESILGNHFYARNCDLQKPFSFGKYKPIVSKMFPNRAQACI